MVMLNEPGGVLCRRAERPRLAAGARVVSTMPPARQGWMWIRIVLPCFDVKHTSRRSAELELGGPGWFGPLRWLAAGLALSYDWAGELGGLGRFISDVTCRSGWLSDRQAPAWQMALTFGVASVVTHAKNLSF